MSEILTGLYGEGLRMGIHRRPASYTLDRGGADSGSSAPRAPAGLRAGRTTSQALAELGKVVKTIFLCRYLRSEALRREIHEGVQVIENWNCANGFIFYGRGGELASNSRDDQELSLLALHLVQNCLVFINTLMLQQVLGAPGRLKRMTPEDRCALIPLIYTHVNPYGVSG